MLWMIELPFIFHDFYVVYSIFTGLSKRTTTEKLHESFSQFGEVVHGLFVSFYLCFYLL